MKMCIVLVTEGVSYEGLTTVINTVPACNWIEVTDEELAVYKEYVAAENKKSKGDDFYVIQTSLTASEFHTKLGISPDNINERIDDVRAAKAIKKEKQLVAITKREIVKQLKANQRKLDMFVGDNSKITVNIVNELNAERRQLESDYAMLP